MSGINIVGVQFRRAGKLYTFSSEGIKLSVGDVVVVDTDRGMSLAEVKKISFVPKGKINLATLKPVLRVAASKDLKRSGRITPEQATSFTQERIAALNLDMRLIEVDVHFGGNKVLVYFSAPGRVDFRELVKDLASGLKSRVELKQVGARDEAKLVGGLGICGREFCCSSWLRDFMPVSIKMAKNQNMALNPSKVSGGCGRLLCCLTYEDKVYQVLRKEMPPKGTKVKLTSGLVAIVQSCDPIGKKIMVETEVDRDRILVALAEVTIIEKSLEKSADADEGGEEIGDDLASLDEGYDTGSDLEDLPADKPHDSGHGRPERSSREHQRDGGGHHDGNRNQPSHDHSRPRDGRPSRSAGQQGDGERNRGRDGNYQQSQQNKDAKGPQAGGAPRAPQQGFTPRGGDQQNNPENNQAGGGRNRKRRHKKHRSGGRGGPGSGGNQGNRSNQGPDGGGGSSGGGGGEQP